MKILKHFAQTLLLVFIFAACSKTSTTETTPQVTPTPIPPVVAKALTITVNNTQFDADGFDEATFTVKDQTNSNVTASSVIYVNNTAITGSSFFTSTVGNYQVKAVKGSQESDVITITAKTPTPSPFTQKTIAEFFTGTWCGICPGTIIPLDNYTSTHPNTIMVGVHGPSGSNDPFQYIYDAQLRSAFNIGGVPTVLLNRDGFWDNANSSLDALALKRPSLGLALETTINGNAINVRSKVKFDVTTSVPLKLVVMLVQDNVQYNQANYGHFGLPNPIVNFNHRNILRATATDVFGDAIPSAEQAKGSTWQKDFSFNASAYNTAQCNVVAFVMYGTNSQNRKGILNAQVVHAGQTKNFD